jgi:hypothetical protein
METWCHSNVIHTYMESLIKRGLLPPRTEALEWVIPSDEEVSVLPDGYVISFIPFHELGLTAPPIDSSEGCCIITRLSCNI